MTGVYLLMREKRVVYVGATENWPNRLAQHREITFTDARLFECDAKDLPSIEKRFILFFKPQHNHAVKEKSRKKITSKWVQENAFFIKECLESGKLKALAEKARQSFNLSYKYVDTDICWSITSKFERLFSVKWDHKKKKFKEIKL